MDSDTDPPLLPLQGPRIIPSTNTRTGAQPSPKRPHQKLPQNKDVTRPTVSLRSTPRDVTMARRPPPTTRTMNDRSAAPTATRKLPARNVPSPNTKPLLPVLERKSQEEKATARRIKNYSDAERSDITPDGSSAGREGRQFTVGNVGNNGRIYLRYVSEHAGPLVTGRRCPRRPSRQIPQWLGINTWFRYLGPPFVQRTSDIHNPNSFSQ